MENENIQQTEAIETEVHDSPKTADELMAEIANLRLEQQRTKSALDKALKGKGEAEKNLRARMTAEEQETEAKRIERERLEEEMAELRHYKQNNEALKRYMMQGMNADMAGKAAEAEINGNYDLLSNIQRQHQDAVLKSAQAEWLRSRPEPNGGADDNNAVNPDGMSDEDYYRTFYKKTI